MTLIGRWERVREYAVDSGAWGPPKMLDRKWGRVLAGPHRRDERIRTGPQRGWESWGEWLRAPNGQWLPMMRGGSFTALQDWPSGLVQLGGGTDFSENVAQRTVGLDSAYTFNSAGDAVGFRLTPAPGKTLAAVYAFLTSAGGTAANVNDLLAELRNDNGSHTSPNRAAPTLHTSVSIDPNADASFVGWHRWDWADYAATPGETLWIIFGDPDGNGTDFANILRDCDAGSLSFGSIESHGAWLYSYNTTDGFSTNAVDPVRAMSIVVIEWSDGSVMGSSRSNQAQTNNDTNRKGLHLSGLTAAIKLYGAMAMMTSGTVPTGVEIYDGSALPGGSTLASTTALFRETTGGATGGLFLTPYELAAADVYRIVLTGTTRIATYTLGTTNGHATMLSKARPGGSDWYLTVANGTTDWSGDITTEWPRMNLLFEDLVASSTPAASAPAAVASFGQNVRGRRRWGM